MSEVVINSKQALDNYIEELRGKWDKHKYLRITAKTGKQRTLTQNKCLHLFCENVAQEMDAAGFDFRRSLRADIDVPWNAALIKEYIWVAVQKAMTGKESTTEPTTKEYGEIYEVVSRHLSEKFGVHVPWPNKEELSRGD